MRKRKTIYTRPIPESKIEEFGKEITKYEWEEVLMAKTVGETVDDP